MKEVLVIDDDELFRTAFKSALNNANIRVEEAANGEEGLKKAKEIKPKVIVVDENMPGLKGHEVIQQVQSEEWGKSIGIFMFTVQNDVGVMNQELKAGIIGYLDKQTASPGDVANIIQNYLGQQKN